MRTLTVTLLALALCGHPANGQDAMTPPDLDAVGFTPTLKPAPKDNEKDKDKIVVREGESVTLDLASENPAKPEDAAAERFGIRPYLEPGLIVPGGGYQTVAFSGTGGLDVERRHFVLESDINWSPMRKVDDGVPGNDKGHTFGYGAVPLARLDRWILGAGAEWGKTITSDYAKEAWSPHIIAGHDSKDVRVQFGYKQEMNEQTHYPELVQFTSGRNQPQFSYTCHCPSGVKEIDFDWWYPNPAKRGHFLFHMNVNGYRFHETVTDPYDLVLTQQETSQHHMSWGESWGSVVRF